MFRLALALAFLLIASGASAQNIPPNPPVQCVNSVVYDASTNGSTQLVAAVTGRTIYICGYSIVAGGTVNVKLIYGTGSACATDPISITPAYQLVAQAGIVDGSPFFRGLATAVSKALCINTSAGQAVQAIVYYGSYN